mgnify:CR=1 FL=1
MENIDEIKQLVIGELLGDGYELEEATKDVEEATITQEGNRIKVTYINGVFDIYEIELVKKLRLIFIK